MPKFLRTLRGLLGHAVILVIIAACVVAGFWQLDRLHQRRTFIAEVTRHMRLAPERLQDLLPASRHVDVNAVAYRRVEVEGTYDSRREVVLVARVLNEQNGNHVLTPLLMADGRAVIVDRGWVPYQLDQPPVREASPPGGVVRLAGVLFPPDATSSPGGGPASPMPQLTKVDLGQLGRQLPYSVAPVYLWLQSQGPPQPGSLPTLTPLPALTASPPHLSYAIQWFTFAAIGLVGYPILLRREAQRRNSPDP
jgi:surfeit locus 1 family protein